MITRVIDINTRMSYGEILRKVYLNGLGEYEISNMIIDNACVSYDLISTENEISVSVLLDEDVETYPTVTKLIMSLETGDLNLISIIKNIWLN